ncbi:MAG: hypothetical protein IT434_15430 [Phycisphaerales bacterium]|nr:hypothetical protein [Phycisphaerales bacterium]
MPSMRWRVVVLVGGCAVVALALASFCIGSPVYYVDKYQGAPAVTKPTALPAAFTPEKQTESHTCGFHALSTVYRAYGLEPEAMRLRFRLGTDKRATNFDSESLGTLHPDMLRVLAQDGFTADLVLDPKSPESIERFGAHVRSGHPAVVLVRVTGLHWIVLAPALNESGEGETMTLVVDSLVESPTEAPLNGVISGRVLSAILISPSR